MLRIAIHLTKDELAALKGAMKAKAGQAVRKAALDIQAHAQANAPVDTGRLKGSIQVEQESDTVAVVGTNVEYAVYVELGTVKMPAHPFMTPAAKAVEPSFRAALKKLV